MKFLPTTRTGIVHRAIEYFGGQYREMLISNLDDYRGSFEDLKYAHLISRRPN